MSIDSVNAGNLSPAEKYPTPVAPFVVPEVIQDEALAANLREAVNNHEALATAAEAVATTVRPQGDVLSGIQERVEGWIEANSPDKISKADVRTLFKELYAGHLGTVGLYDLDATVAFAKRLWAEEIALRRGSICLPKLGRTALEAAPALHYVSPARREQVAEVLGLKDGLLSTLHDQSSITEAVASRTTTSSRPEQARKQDSIKFGVRGARASDIPAMVDVDMRAFRRVYQEYGLTEDALRTDLISKFTHRLELLGSEWMPVVTAKDESGNERIVGLMTACPTNKTPDEFESWEKTTNYGTLDGLYDPKGKHLYIVTLSMDPSVHGQNGEDQAYMRLMGKMLEHRIEYAYFESRMPGFGTWVKKHCRQNSLSFEELSGDDKALMGLAEHYAGLTKVVNGKEVPYDKLLGIYSGKFGCDLKRVVANAYKDVPSMNFGAVYTFDNPLPIKRRGPVVSWIAGKVLSFAAKSTALSQRLMKGLEKLL